ncbi:hypothetical protein MMC14_001644 [Varicellaria rhodocarpa]|nr:hypothetical protein [Varicellaria rhodocarpa]
MLLYRIEEDITDFTIALGTLQAFSFITVEKGGTDFEMHRLVQLSIQHWLELEGTINHYEDWEICEGLLPHVQVVVGYNLGTQPSLLQRATILNNAAWHNVFCGRYGVAHKKSMEANEIRLKILGAEHPDTVNSMADLAWIYSLQGQRKEAEKLIIKVIEIRKRILGIEHEVTLDSLETLVEIFMRQERWKEAEQLQMNILETNKKVLGAKHNATLETMANLGETYRRQGRLTEAEK